MTKSLSSVSKTNKNIQKSFPFKTYSKMIIWAIFISFGPHFVLIILSTLLKGTARDASLLLAAAKGADLLLMLLYSGFFYPVETLKLRLSPNTKSCFIWRLRVFPGGSGAQHVANRLTTLKKNTISRKIALKPQVLETELQRT